MESIPPDRYNITVGVIYEGILVKEIPSWITVRKIGKQKSQWSINNFLKKGKIPQAIVYAYRRMRFKLLKEVLSMNLRKMVVDCLPEFEGKYDVAVSWGLPDANENIYVLEKVSAARKYMWIHMDLNYYRMPPDSNSYIERFDRVICVSKACKMSFDKHYPFAENKSTVCYNVLDANSIRTKAAQSIDFVFPKDTFSILTCGRLASEKRLFYAIDICQRLIENGKDNIRWYFLGDGPLKSALCAEIEKRNLEKYFVFLGTKKNPYPYIAGADIYVQMSRHEAFCLALAEAQILGVPAVSTNFPSASEIINDGKTGLIVLSEWEAVFNGIKKLIDDKQYLELLRENAKQCDCLKFSGNYNQFEKIVFDN